MLDALAGVAAPRNRRDTATRSVLKATTWRVTGSLDTILLAYLFTQDVTTSAAIGLTEVLTKTVLYYVHERAWTRVRFGAPID